MSSFTTRVELHSGSYDDYTTLHSKMAAEGYSRFIMGDTGVTYHMPWAEYNLNASISANDALERAKRAVQAVGKSAAILVTEAYTRVWNNLERK